MAKSHKPKKSSVFLCCFGSNFSREISMRESDKFSWQSVRKKTDSKTVPFDASLPDDHKERRAHHRVHSRKWRWKLFKSRSNTQKPLIKESQIPATNPQQPRQRPPVVSVTPIQTPPQTRQRERAQQNPENDNGLPRLVSLQEDAGEESDSAQAGSHSVSLPASKRRQNLMSSPMPGQLQTTLDRAVRSGNAGRYQPYDSAFGLSAVMVTLVILIVWGRLCAILCTAAWLYLFPRIRRAIENDTIKNLNSVSKELDLDSEIYKKKVILEGLLARNHQARHENSGD